MFLTAVNPQPLSTPGWQIETKYSTKVLTGNWVEERRKFTRDTDKTPQSIYGKECIPFPDHRPDQISRWYGKRKVEGGSREARNKVVDIFWNWGILVFGGTQEIIQLSGRRCQVSFSKLCGLLVRDEANCCSATQAKNVLRFHSSSARVAYLHTAFRDPR
uniref:uncharacterized protein C1orf158 homolog isoform X2 n=1 Tax=Macaca mulatta TaxID=9544 RepID=UPI0010A2137A|nr:uncharacterized protein C1orf158 homolog isoform X2 [Macaca mulatta]